MNLSKISDRLPFFKSLYRENRDKQSALYERMERYFAQYKGSKELDGAKEDASVVRNITYELIESQVSTQIPAPAAEARYYTEQNDRNARSIERLCASLRHDLPFEYLNDMDERYTYIYGGSVWLAEWDDSAETNGRHGEVKLYCLPPADFVPEAGIYSLSEMEYCFLRFITTKNDVARRYGVSVYELENEGTPEGESDESIELIVCFWRDDEGRIAKFAFAGDEAAKKIFHESARRLGQGLAIIIDILNPEAIVIGSVYARSEALFAEGMYDVLEKEALRESLSVCRILPAKLGESIGDIAAICVAMEEN